LAEPEFQAWLPKWVMVLPETVPLSVLLAVALEVLKALLKVPVEPLLSAADRSPAALEAPEFWFWLLSLVLRVVARDVVVAELVVLLAVLVLLLELSAVVVLRVELSVRAVVMLLVLPPSVVCVPTTCAMAAELSP
jgi:hypothetical protein